MKRRADLDYARGIAIILILVGHSNGLSPIADKLIYSFHVPLFFVISGILLCHNQTSKRDWTQLMRGWMRRIVIPVIIWECLLSASYLVIKDIPLHQLIINSLTLNFNLSALWFVPTLLCAEILWILIEKCGRSIHWQACLAVMLIAGFAAEWIGILFLRRTLVALVFVAFGYLLELLRRNESLLRLSENWLAVCGTAVLWLTATACSARADLNAGVLNQPVLYYLHSAGGSLFVLLLCGKLSKNLRVLPWVGQNSFGFLVTHVFIRHALIAVEERLFGCFYGGWLLAIPTILIDMVVVWVIAKIAPEVFGQARRKRS